MLLKRNLLIPLVSLLLLASLVAACGNSSPTTSGSSAPTPTPTTASAPTPTPTSASGGGTVVKTTSATVGGKTMTILTNAQGMALYYDTQDTPTSVTCTGGCASAWPPLLFSGSGTPTSATPLPGTLTVYNGALGAQVEYQGHPLYTYVSDTAPGQVTGQGVGNFLVATPSLTAASGGGGGSATPTPTSSTGY